MNKIYKKRCKLEHCTPLTPCKKCMYKKNVSNVPMPDNTNSYENYLFRKFGNSFDFQPRKPKTIYEMVEENNQILKRMKKAIFGVK